MNQNGQHTINQLAGKFTLNNKSKEELESVIGQYPYFGFAHLILAKKLQEEKEPKAAKQLQKTAIYFYNPFWLNYLLQQSEIVYPAVVAPEIMAVEEIKPVTADKQTAIAISNEAIDEDDLPADDEAKEDISNPVVQSRMARLMEQHLSDFKKPVEKQEEIIAKPNPFHTVDYFASQGIKLLAGMQGADALGNKVKSFTEWLKQMKRINQQPTDLGTDTETEKMIETIALTSNETKDVVTVAMAEVLVKQGKTEKAVQLYQKLSFLNPSKSTYFAAKIQELKDK